MPSSTKRQMDEREIIYISDGDLDPTAENRRRKKKKGRGQYLGEVIDLTSPETSGSNSTMGTKVGFITSLKKNFNEKDKHRYQKILRCWICVFRLFRRMKDRKRSWFVIINFISVIPSNVCKGWSFNRDGNFVYHLWPPSFDSSFVRYSPFLLRIWINLLFRLVECGHSFCKLCICKWFHTQKPYSCPCCRKRVTTRPTEEFQLKQIVDTIRKALGMRIPEDGDSDILLEEWSLDRLFPEL